MKLSLLLLLLMLLAGCGAEPLSPASETHILREARLARLAEELERAEERWRTAAIDNYELDLHYFTFGMEIWATISVRQDQVAELSCRPGTMFDETNQDQCDHFENSWSYFTVPSLFEIARGVIEGARSHPRTEISMRFDPENGYPDELSSSLGEYSEWDVLVLRPLE